MSTDAEQFTSTKTRATAADTLSAASSVMSPSRTGLGQRLALAGTVLKLARRYPIPALIVGGIALAYYIGRRHAHARVPRY